MKLKITKETKVGEIMSFLERLEKHLDNKRSYPKSVLYSDGSGHIEWDDQEIVAWALDDVIEDVTQVNK
tara:strand:- start:5799 stop:6005 length:207 start_codon:yes stop_codon:yes gene_type:complete